MARQGPQPAYLSHVKGEPWTDEQIRSLGEAIESGTPATEIAGHLGLHPHRVREIAARRGYHAPARGESTAKVARAIERRIRVRGPQSRTGLIELPYHSTQLYKALRWLQDHGRIHVSRRERSPKGGRTIHYWGLVGVHPYAPDSKEQILAVLRDGRAQWPTHIANEIGLERSTVVTHLHSLEAARKVVRVEGPLRRVYFRAVA